MTASILSLLAIGAAALWWWLQRKTDPKQQHRERYEQIDQDISDRDSASATVNSGDDLDELERLQNARGDSAGHAG